MGRTSIFLALAVSSSLAARSLAAQDCNENGVADDRDIAAGTSRDCNGNGIPDECDVRGSAFAFEDASTWARFPISGSPIALAAADLDGDGRPEIVSTQSGGATGPGLLTVSWNEGARTFSSPQKTEIVPFAFSLAAADLDDDGTTDLAASGIDGISVVLNRGGRSLEPATVLSTSPGAEIVAADFDGDGRTDLAAAARDLTIVLNRGGGRFEGVVTFDPVGWNGPVAVTDFDGDGNLDVALADADRKGVTVLLGKGDGRFAAADAIPIEWRHLLVPLDLDGDGRPDLVLRAADRFAVFGNVGGGRFRERDPLPIEAGGHGAATADFDGDGDLDLLTFGTQGQILVNDGGRLHVSPVLGRSRMNLAAAADFDGDGRTDIASAVSDSTGGVASFLYSRGGVEFEAGPFAVLGTVVVEDDFIQLMQTADLDGDDRREVVVGLSHGQVPFAILWNRGDEILSPPEFSLVQGWHAIIAPRIDGEGRAAIVERTDDGLETILVRGRGVLDPPVHYDLDPARQFGLLLAEDLDGDGRTDIALSGTSLGVLLNRGDGTFGSPILSRGEGFLRGFADFRGSGLPDLLLFQYEAAALVLHENLGGGAFADPVTVLPATPNTEVLVADLDGDGRPDLTVWDNASSDARLTLFFGEGASFSPPASIGLGGEPMAVSAGDLDGDGDPDLLVTCLAYDAALDAYGTFLTIVWNRGARSFAAGDAMLAGVRVAGASLADLDGDGLPDLLATIAEGDVRLAGVFLNQGGGRFSFRALARTGSIQAADLDGSGHPALLWMEGGELVVAHTRSVLPASADANRNRVPDECEVRFHRGDASGDGALDLTDALVTLAYLFDGGPAPPCAEAADVQGDGRLDVTDALATLAYLFLGGPPPAAPGPPGRPCGLDGARPGGAGDLGCASYAACR